MATASGVRRAWLVTTNDNLDALRFYQRRGWRLGGGRSRESLGAAVTNCATHMTRAARRGRGVPVVFDSVGKDTFHGSLDCLRPLGMLVMYGQASGKVPPFDPGILMAKGSLFLTRPTLVTYTATREDLESGSAELFDVVRKGIVKNKATEETRGSSASRSRSSFRSPRPAARLAC